MMRAIETVTVDTTVSRYCVDLSGGHSHSRTHHGGASPRGALGLLLARVVWPWSGAATTSIPEDVKAVAHPVLAHRLTLRPELWMTSVNSHTVVDAVLGTVAGAVGSRAGLSVPESLSGARLVRPQVAADLGAHPRGAARGRGPLFAVAFHRPDVLVASTPIVVIAGWSVLTRPSGDPTITPVPRTASVREGEGCCRHAQEVDASPGTQEISVAYRGHRWVRT